MQRADSLEKNPDAGKDSGQEEKGETEDEMVGWNHQLNRHEFEQTPGHSEGQVTLACCSPWGCKELDMSEPLNSNKTQVWPLELPFQCSSAVAPLAPPPLFQHLSLSSVPWVALPLSSSSLLGDNANWKSSLDPFCLKMKIEFCIVFNGTHLEFSSTTLMPWVYETDFGCSSFDGKHWTDTDQKRILLVGPCWWTL